MKVKVKGKQPVKKLILEGDTEDPDEEEEGTEEEADEEETDEEETDEEETDEEEADEEETEENQSWQNQIMAKLDHLEDLLTPRKPKPAKPAPSKSKKPAVKVESKQPPAPEGNRRSRARKIGRR